ncbi:MAG: hypothetical protein AAGK21_12265 [Bacteroidota bacterium]
MAGALPFGLREQEFEPADEVAESRRVGVDDDLVRLGLDGKQEATHTSLVWQGAADPLGETNGIS